MIKVAVVGTGFGEKVHIPGFQAHPHTEVVAVYHRDINKAKTIADKHHIPHACDTVENIVALPEVEAVSISTPPFLHYEMAKTVLEAGKHLFLEKPTTLRAGDAKKLYQLAQAKGLIANVDFEFRFIPAWQLFSELLSANYVGQIRLIKIDWLGASRADVSRPWTWYSSSDKGGGVLGSLGSHVFDYISWLFGPVGRLNAHFNTVITERFDPVSKRLKPVDTDDHCMVMLELTDGTPCQIVVSSAVYAPRPHWVEVYGERGTLIVGSENQKDYIYGFHVWGSQFGQPMAELPIPSRFTLSENFEDGRISGFLNIIDQWVRGIEEKRQTIPSLREGVYAQLLIDLCHQSYKQASWVDVPSLESFLAD